MKRNWFTSGEWNALCDVCGFKRKASELQARWDGLMVCAPTIKSGCWEMRHPQELIRPLPDSAPLPWTRPEPADIFIDVPTPSTMGCTLEGMLSQADYGTADCAIAGNINGGLVP